MNYRQRITNKLSNSGQPVFLLILIIILAVCTSIANPRFLQSTNIINIVKQVSVTGIAAMSVVVLMVSGGIDLSIGSLISLVSSVAGRLLMDGMNPLTVTLIALLVSTACGLMNGLIATLSKCAPFIITLGTMSVFSGMALLITEGNIINFPRDSYTLLGSSQLGIIPSPVIVYLIVFAVVSFFLAFTRTGRRVYAIGGNDETAYLSGIRVTKYKIILYSVSGFIVGIAALVLMSRLGSASAVMGSGYELRAIAAAVIGGMTLSGGKGTPGGAFLGVLLLGIISNSLNILNVSSYYQNIVLGAIIVIAIVFSNAGRQKS